MDNRNNRAPLLSDDHDEFNDDVVDWPRLLRSYLLQLVHYPAYLSSVNLSQIGGALVARDDRRHASERRRHASGEAAVPEICDRELLEEQRGLWNAARA